MAKDKASVTLDRTKVAAAKALIGATSTSEVIDVALDRLIRAERLRSDIDAYLEHPQTSDETALGNIPPGDDLSDDTDWEMLYPVGGP